MNTFGYIYKITNLINGKIYIGCTIFDINDRWKSHITAAKKGSSAHLHRAIRKYGEDKFVIICIDIAIDKNELHFKEKLYIEKHDSFKNGMNMTIGGDGTYGFKHSKEYKKMMSKKMEGNQFALGHKHNAETLEKIRKTSLGNAYAKGLKHTPEFCEAISMRTKGKKNPFYGKKHSTKVIRKISERMMGNTFTKGIKHTEQTRMNMSKAHKGKKLSEKTKEKLRLAGTGRKHTQESKDKMRLAKMGHTVSMETRIKISNTLKGVYYG